MKNSKLLRAIALILCLSCALISCEISDGDTSKDINVEASTPSENSVIDITSEDSSAEESSDIPVESSEESSEEVSGPVEESSEEVSDPEPDYVKKMDDEMADLYLSSICKFTMPKNIHSDEFKEYLFQQYIVKGTYHAFGDLNGYTLFTTNNQFFSDFIGGKYRAGDYLFETNDWGFTSIVYLFLYRDNEMLIFEDAYEQGLFDPKDAYELINSNPAPKNGLAIPLNHRATKIED